MSCHFTFDVIGVMSGTSLDGIDLLHTQISYVNKKWDFNLYEAETIPYSKKWKDKLHNAVDLSGLDLSLLDVEYGELLGETISKFMQKHALSPDFIAVHGHTIFHQPHLHLSLQIGEGAAIASITGCKVINHFRNKDVAMGGQGAPLVPIGDALLFSEYDFCLNLGGIANISYPFQEKRIAFDTSICNMALNYVSQKIGLAYDNKGALARSGHFNSALFEQLNRLAYYSQKPPKTLGYEWFLTQCAPILDSNSLTTEDLLHTLCEHIGFQNGKIIKSLTGKSLLVTGGGALNDFLIECIQKHCALTISKADRKLIDYKEALVFAFLGVLRYMEIPNSLQSVTGAQNDSIGGVIHL
ncbi:MAG: anhydro-N-acetylmuramic acid kinase [Bacteroidales bacterium]